MATEERPVVPQGRPRGPLCRVVVPHRDGSRDVLFMRESLAGPWQALGDDVTVTPLEDGYVVFDLDEEATGE